MAGKQDRLGEIVLGERRLEGADDARLGRDRRLPALDRFGRMGKERIGQLLEALGRDIAGAERSFSSKSASAVNGIRQATPMIWASSTALASLLATIRRVARTSGWRANAVARARPVSDRPQRGTGTLGSIVTSA